MTKEEVKHLSDVLKAYSEGKEIEKHVWVSLSCGESEEWQKIDNLTPDIISHCTLRIKPKPECKYRPYTNAEEFLKAQKEHGPYLKGQVAILKGEYHIPQSIQHYGVAWTWTNWPSARSTYVELFDAFTWQDGTPCGKSIE